MFIYNYFNNLSKKKDNIKEVEGEDKVRRCREFEYFNYLKDSDVIKVI